MSKLLVLILSLALCGCTRTKPLPAATALAPSLSAKLPTVTDDGLGAGGLLAQIVQIQMSDGSLGSGFWIASDRVVTCMHVVAKGNPSDVLVKSSIDALFDYSNRNFSRANWIVFHGSVVATDVENDLAIIQLSHPASEHVAIKINGSGLSNHISISQLKVVPPEPLETVYLAGFPLGVPHPVVQKGGMAAISGPIPLQGLPGESKLFISLVANHGNSGGPIFDKHGQVVGVLESALPSLPNVTDPAAAVSGIAVAIPAFYVQELLKRSPAP